MSYAMYISLLVKEMSSHVKVMVLLYLLLLSQLYKPIYTHIRTSRFHLTQKNLNKNCLQTEFNSIQNSGICGQRCLTHSNRDVCTAFHYNNGTCACYRQYCSALPYDEIQMSFYTTAICRGMYVYYLSKGKH